MVNGALPVAPVGRVFMVTWWLGEFGGAEQLITDHAIALTEAGAEVTVFSEMPAAGRNQYLHRLVTADVRVVAPSGLLGRALQWAIPRLRRRTTAQGTQSTPGTLARARAAIGWAPRRIASAVTRRRLRRAISSASTGDRNIVVNIHGFGVDMAWLAPWARERGLPVVYVEHGSIDEHGGARSRHAADWLATADLVICVPGAAQQAIGDLMPGREHEFRPIPHIVAGGPIASEPHEARGRAESGTLRIGFVGRLVRDKGIDILIRAFASLAKDHSDARLLLFGDGEDREAFRGLVREFNVDDIVEFRGAFEHSRIGAVMSEIDVFVLASLTEALPLVVLEAMAFAKPIVATDVGSISSVVKHDANGLLVPAGDASALEGALRRLAADPKLRATLAQGAAQAFVDGGFSAEAAASKLLGYYGEAAELAAGRRGGSTPK